MKQQKMPVLLLENQAEVAIFDVSTKLKKKGT